jgi:AcrR family transcriptional regulator
MLPATPRERILRTAIRLFSEEGIHVVGIDRILAEADVAPRTLYRHFRGKDALVAAALEEWSNQWLHWLNQQLIGRRGDDPVTRFLGLWDALEEWLAAEGQHGFFVANAAIELRSVPDHPAFKVIAAHRTVLRQVIEEAAELAGLHHPVELAGQLQLLLDGAVAAEVTDRRPAVASLRPLVDATVRAHQ